MKLRPPTPEQQATVTASGIAKMAGVGRAAVSNWRRRYSDFPSPVGGTVASPVFDAMAVGEWLRRQGKLNSVGTQEWVWRHIESYEPAVRMGDALCIAGSYLLVVSWSRGSTPRKAGGSRLLSPKQLMTKLRAKDKDLAAMVDAVLPAEWSAQLETILRMTDQLALEEDPGTAFEDLHARYVTSARSSSGPDSTPDALARIMLSMAGTGRKVFDFTSGTGSILHVAAEKALERKEMFQSFGQEVKPQHALVTLLRLWFVHSRAQEAGLMWEAPCVRVGDSLLADAFPQLDADVVAANPPFGIHDWGHERLAYDPRWAFGLPPRTEPELAWVQHALSHLAPGKRAVLLMPPAAAVRPAGRRIRGELVRLGALEAVIALPAGMLPPAAVGLHIWVLRHPKAKSPVVPGLLLVDAAGSDKTRATDVDAVAGIVGRAWKAFLSPSAAKEEPGVYRVVSPVEVLDEQVDLSPRRYLPLPGRPMLNADEIVVRIQEFADLVGKVHRELPKLKADRPSPLSTAHTAEIADLIKSGSLSVHRAITRLNRPVDARIVEMIVLTGVDVVSGSLPTGIATDLGGDREMAKVESGDVLIPVIARHIVARVATDEQVGATLGAGVHAVRVDPEVLDPWFLAGVLSHTDTARVAGRVSNSSAGMLRIDVRRLAVPVLPIEVQRSYGNAFRQLADFHAALAKVNEIGGELARDITDGLGAGGLTVDFSR